MFCPKCGAAADAEWHYCKRCGGLLPGPRNRRFENAFLIMPYLNLLCAILAAASFVSLLLAFPGDGGGWPAVVAGVSCFLIAAYQLAVFVMGLPLRKRFLEGRGTARAGAVEAGGGVGRHALDDDATSSFVRAAGATEGTTELLEALPNESKKARDA